LRQRPVSSQSSEIDKKNKEINELKTKLEKVMASEKRKDDEIK
jgi:hypothetical protein